MDNLILFYTLIILTFIPKYNNSHEIEDTTIAVFKVKTGNMDRYESTVSIPIENITNLPDSLLNLYELTNQGRILTKIQFFYSSNIRHMFWRLCGGSKGGTERQYELVLEPNKNHSENVSVTNENGNYEFNLKGKKILKYNSNIVFPPEGVDNNYKRSGFINPLYAPNQFELTRTPVASSDHFHHYGLWNAWKKVQFRGEEIDLWNPRFMQGTVKHAGVISISEGSIFSSLRVLLEHVAWHDSENETVAINEEMTIKVYNNSKNHFLIDINSAYNPTESLIIKEYEYAGFSFRANDYWTNSNTKIFTSENLDRNNANGVKTRWVMIIGNTPQGPVSMLIMSHPENYNHPEQIRIWPSNANKGVGNVFINFSPTRDTDWLMETGKSYLLKYRIFITDGFISLEEAEKIWHDYSKPPEVVWVKNNK